MKKVKTVKKFVIYELNNKEIAEYGFRYAPVLKEHVDTYGTVTPADADLECGSYASAVAHAMSFDDNGLPNIEDEDVDIMPVEGMPCGVFTKEHCVRDMYTPAPESESNSNIGKWAILAPKSLKDEFCNWECQLVFLTGGFGCTPTGRGGGCFGHELGSKQEYRNEKDEFIGIANDEIQAFANRYQVDIFGVTE